MSKQTLIGLALIIIGPFLMSYGKYIPKNPIAYGAFDGFTMGIASIGIGLFILKNTLLK